MTANPVRVIGVDPGLGTTGFGVLDKRGAKVSAVCYGTIRPPAKFALPNRLKHLYVEIDKIIREYTPDMLAIEDTFYQKNVKSTLALGQARGTILLAGAITIYRVWNLHRGK